MCLRPVCFKFTVACMSDFSVCQNKTVGLPPLVSPVSGWRWGKGCWRRQLNVTDRRGRGRGGKSWESAYWRPAGGAGWLLSPAMCTSETRDRKSLSAVCHRSQVNVWPSANRCQEPGADSAPQASPRRPPANCWAHPCILQFLSFSPSLYLFCLQLHHPPILILHHDNWNRFVWQCFASTRLVSCI